MRWTESPGRLEADWTERLGMVRQELAALFPTGERFILVDEDQLRAELPAGMNAIPFLSRSEG
jgi:hypothetical protein